MGFINSELFNQRMEVWIENTVEMDYVEKCIENFETLTDDIIDKICERACAYYKFMLEEWNDEFVKEITEKNSK